jgi:hypothetical protein
MQWLFRKKTPETLFQKISTEHLNILEDKLDFLILGTEMATQAYTDLTSEIGVAVSTISNLAAQIASHVVGTPDTDLATLTTQLKAATDSVVAILTPAVVAPVEVAPAV